MPRVEVKPGLLRWARDRARLGTAALERRFPKLAAWEEGRSLPTLRQLEDYARATYTPVGLFFLTEPPIERLPIPDFRTMASAGVQQPSAGLLDTIYACQRRQEWYREQIRITGERPLPFVGSLAVGAATVAAAETMRQTLTFDLTARRSAATWEAALTQLVELAEDAGVLVMRNGIVGSNTHRPLDPNEFRGFTLADPYAPVVFINAADTKAAQMFTLAHELVHVWIGQSALDDLQPTDKAISETEQWCNAVAAELLVPLAMFRHAYQPHAPLPAELRRLARDFKVSTLVILLRVRDMGELTGDAFREAYDAELERLIEVSRGTEGGGNFHATEAIRVSRRFARALVASTLEGQTLYRDAFKLLGFSKMETFRAFSASLGATG